MILLIDNYDSFTRNLYQYFCELGADVLVRRNDELTLAQIDALSPQKIVISQAPARRMTLGSHWMLFVISRARRPCWVFVWDIRLWRRPLARQWFGQLK